MSEFAPTSQRRRVASVVMMSGLFIVACSALGRQSQEELTKGGRSEQGLDVLWRQGVVIPITSNFSDLAEALEQIERSSVASAIALNQESDRASQSVSDANLKVVAYRVADGERSPVAEYSVVVGVMRSDESGVRVSHARSVRAVEGAAVVGTMGLPIDAKSWTIGVVRAENCLPTFFIDYSQCGEVSVELFPATELNGHVRVDGNGDCDEALRVVACTPTVGSFGKMQLGLGVARVSRGGRFTVAAPAVGPVRIGASLSSLAPTEGRYILRHHSWTAEVFPEIIWDRTWDCAFDAPDEVELRVKIVRDELEDHATPR
ncbi:MAG: hypothetical protein R3C29_17895 [Dehalococcoidia bacterium]